jgi:hypothetical protein
MNKITPELKFLTKEDLLNLCDEAQKPTALGELAILSLNAIVSILDKKATDFYNEAIYYGNERKKWFFYNIAAVIVCIIFCPKIPVNHALFWINIGFLAAGFIGARHTKKLFFYYKNKHSKIFETLVMINKALNLDDVQKV